jgi:hypothetical protein
LAPFPVGGGSRRDVSRAAVHAMQKAFDKAGIQFIASNGGGPGLPPRLKMSFPRQPLNERKRILCYEK